MDRGIAARRLVAELVKDAQLEVRRAEIVGRDLARFVEELGRPPSGHELEGWLGEHAQVTELYAGPGLLDELVERHLAPPPPSASEPAGAAEARHPELERQLREAPDSRELYLVYADWLQERADPLGELIALGVAATDGAEGADARFERHLRLHEARLLGGLARQLGGRVTLRWRHGLVHAIEEVGVLPPAQWRELLRLRVCELVQSVTLRGACAAELDAAIGEHAPASLRDLRLEAYHGRLPERLLGRDLRALTVAGGHVAIPPGLSAAIERLELRVQDVVIEGGGPPRLPVRELHVALTPPLVALLAGARLPRLERLTLALGGVPAAALPGLLEALDAPALTHLGICDGGLDPRTFGALAGLPLAARLSSLALTHLALTDDAMRELARARGAFPALAELDVSHNELSRDGLAAARDLAPGVISRRQHRRGAAMEQRVRRWAGSRLLAAEEIADPDAWRDAGQDGDVRWARYRGGDEYELFVTVDLQRYGCSCPSSIQPCKHVVALALVAERTRLPAAAAGGIEDRVAQVPRDRFDAIWE